MVNNIMEDMKKRRRKKSGVKRRVLRKLRMDWESLKRNG